MNGNKKPQPYKTVESSGWGLLYLIPLLGANSLYHLSIQLSTVLIDTTIILLISDTTKLLYNFFYSSHLTLFTNFLTISIRGLSLVHIELPHDSASCSIVFAIVTTICLEYWLFTRYLPAITSG
jgi:hypothetical protein